MFSQYFYFFYRGLFLIEIFFLIKPIKLFQPLIKGVCFVSQYTLILYIYHQGIHQIFSNPPTGSAAFFWAIFSLVTGVPIAFLIHSAYLLLENWVDQAWCEMSIMIKTQW